jgi:hypothetical protein
MDRQKTEGFGPVDLFELSGKLLPTLPWFPRTEKLAEQVADLIVGNRFLVKYDKTTAPVIDAAIMRNPLLDQEQGEAMLYSLWEDEYILLYDAENHPPMLASLQDDETGYVEFLTYEDCVAYAEAELNNLLRFASFDYRRYMLYLGAAFAIARAGHPDWIYETFIECFRKDVVCEMDDRSKDDLGYRDYVASLAHE